MQQHKKLTLRDLNGDFKIYFLWSATVLSNPAAVDNYLLKNKNTILKVSQKLLRWVNYVPAPIYRGIILRERVNEIKPNEKLPSLSFSADRSVAEHFADIKGFGSQLVNIEEQLGTFGYVIEYTPKTTEVLFHYRFLSILPYAEAFNLNGMQGQNEVEYLKKQKEVTILQPKEPFINITKMFE